MWSLGGRVHAPVRQQCTRGGQHTRAQMGMVAARTFPCEQGGGNPFGDMGKLMESVKKAQQMVQVETQRVQQELEK